MSSLTEQDAPDRAPVGEARAAGCPRPVHVLVTGFGPYPGVRRNPTAALMRAVEARMRTEPSAQVSGGELTVSYGRAMAELGALLEARRPDAVLLLGLAARARWVRIERHARLLDSPLHPDAEGKSGARKPAGGAGAMPLRATAATEPALAIMRRHGLRGRLSGSAGRYLCNASYAFALSRAAGRPVLFIHVPWPRRAGARRSPDFAPSAAMLATALCAIARQLAIAARRVRTEQEAAAQRL